MVLWEANMKSYRHVTLYINCVEILHIMYTEKMLLLHVKEPLLTVLFF